VKRVAQRAGASRRLVIAVLGGLVLLAPPALGQSTQPATAASPPSAIPPAEPEGYRLDAYRAPVPATLNGARVLDAAAAAELWRKGGVAFVDVLPRPPKPAGLPAGTLWRDQPHSTIPGAVWLPNVGFGALNAETESYFRAGLSAVTRGDVNAPLVIFCQRDCWMSWNAAKRALAYGYTDLSWFPTGVDGWGEAGLPLEAAEPRP
jgi:PQQ-dependent catabolism-associated CXXCW motif protein